MQALLSILFGVALLLWGTHIVRSGVLRVFGGNLRAILAGRVSNRGHAAHLDRLLGQTAQSIETSSLHLDIINDFKRINSHFCALAYPILEAAGVLAPSRLREDVANGAARNGHA